MCKSLIAGVAVASVFGWVSVAFAATGAAPFGTPPNMRSPASVAWLTPHGIQTTPGLTRLFPNLLGISAGVLPSNYSWGATSPGLMVNGFPVA